jgi:DNA-binding SARP family transcriptional activator
MVAELELNFLGELEVIRDGQVMKLPPSKKTRGLLAYLALNERSFRREHLCELLWEIPDDPRGSLRWSLSKLRRLVDDDRTRIVADRSNVGFDASHVTIDLLGLRSLVANDLQGASIDELEASASRYRGNFLEGLELSNFHEFHAWCIAERELAAQAQARVLRTLLERFAGESPQFDRALPHARALVGISSYDEAARAGLIELLVGLGRVEEAQQQYEFGIRMLEEVGAESSGALYRAWRGGPGAAPRAVAPTVVPPVVRSQAAPLQLPNSSSVSPTVDVLVGRSSEMARLEGVMADVIEHGRAAFVLLRGDPGIGKSRLLQAVAERSREADAFLLQASAFESEVIRPFALWVDALRRLPGGPASDIFSADDHDNRDRLFGALSDLVERESRDRPVVLIFDDLHWCDESSAAALHYVARMNQHRGVLGILAAREDELRDNAAVQQALRGLLRDKLFQELKLAPLSPAACRALIEERAPQADSGLLSRECGGNPLLAIELARAETEGESGSSLDELIRERLDRSDDEGGELLMWAAVLSPRIDIGSLARLTGFDSNRIGEMLESAERQTMLRSSEQGLQFSHDLIARGVYAEISPARRRVMHRRVAELLEQDTAVDLERAADLAHHASQSGDPALAARAMVSAGRLCLRFFANDEAASLARKGFALVAQLTGAERVCLTLDLHDVMLVAAPLDDWEASAAEYVALAEQALDHGVLAHARLGYQMASYVRWLHGQWTGAREETLQAERVTRSGSDAEHIVGMAETAKCLAMLERDLTQADAMLMEAQALAVRQRISHPALPAAAGMLRFHENKLDEAEEFFQEARTLCKSVGDRINEFQANEYLLMIDFERGRFAAAMARCSALLEIGGKLREGSEEPFARALEGLCRYALDDETDSLDAGLEELRIADAKHRLAYILTRGALLDVERGRPERALPRAGEALGYAELLERPTEMMLAHIALAQTHQAGDEAGEYKKHVAAIADFEVSSAARWALNRAAALMSSE